MGKSIESGMSTYLKAVRISAADSQRTVYRYTGRHTCRSSEYYECRQTRASRNGADTRYYVRHRITSLWYFTTTSAREIYRYSPINLVKESAAPEAPNIERLITIYNFNYYYCCYNESIKFSWEEDKVAEQPPEALALQKIEIKQNKPLSKNGTAGNLWH